MGDIKIGSNTISSAYFGNTEISKIYYGNTLVYEKVSFLPVTAYLSSQTPNPQNCTVDKVFSYTFTQTTTINITPTCSSGEWNVFLAYQAGTSNSSYHDIVDETFGLTGASDARGAHAPVVTVDNITTDVYFTFKHAKGSITTSRFDYNKSGTSTGTYDIDMGSGGVGINASGASMISGRNVRVVGEITFTNALGNTYTQSFDETKFSLSSATTANMLTSCGSRTDGTMRLYIMNGTFNIGGDPTFGRLRITATPTRTGESMACRVYVDKVIVY